MKFYQLKPEQRRELLQAEGIKLEKINEEVLNRLEELRPHRIGQLR